jgi:hypothetical protein
MSLRWMPTETLVVDGNVTWSHPRGLMEDWDVQWLDEKPVLLSPGSATYVFPFGLSLMGQARYVGGVRTKQPK